MHIVSLNVGRPQIVLRGGRQHSSAINRRSVDGAVELSPDGLAGDRVSDSSVHGGPDKAVCCYPHEHYAHWRERLAAELPVPSFGENLTTAGLLEDEVCIGDTFRIGGAIVQITQPRQPCWKLANKHAEPRLVAWVNESARTGFYFRVLQACTLQQGDAIELVDRPHPDLTVAAIMRLRRSASPDLSLAARLADLPELSAAWRQHFAKRLGGDDERLATGE